LLLFRSDFYKVPYDSGEIYFNVLAATSNCCFGGCCVQQINQGNCLCYGLLYSNSTYELNDEIGKGVGLICLNVVFFKKKFL
jgi:hypothetical protein